MFSASACSITGSPATPTRAVLEFPTSTPIAPSPSSTPTPDQIGTELSCSDADLVLPQQVGSGVSAESVPASLDSSQAPWDVHPAHSRCRIEGYPLQGKFFEPEILIYPAPEFSQLHEGAAAIITNLQTILANPNGPLPAQLPFLPLFNASQVFTSQPKVIQFENGSGISYLTQFAQYAATVNNRELFYTFQGLSSDGKYYVVAILPVNAAFLAATEDPAAPIPQGGIPFEEENPSAYYSAVVEKLNETPAGDFTPSLGSLDALMQSIELRGQ